MHAQGYDAVDVRVHQLRVEHSRGGVPPPPPATTLHQPLHGALPGSLSSPAAANAAAAAAAGGSTGLRMPRLRLDFDVSTRDLLGGTAGAGVGLHSS